MGISQKIKTAMKLLKEIAHEYSTMTRKNKCIPGTKKKGHNSKKRETKKSVRFNKPLTMEPVKSVEEPAEPNEEISEPVEKSVEPVEKSVENPFEQSIEEEPVEEPESETNPIDDGLTR